MARKLGDKDKKKRKSRSLLINSTLLGVPTIVGGYVGGKDSKVKALERFIIKRAKDKNINDKSVKVVRKITRKQVKNIEDYVKTAPKSKTARVNRLFNKIRNVSISKGALIGLGVGSALLGANELRNRISKKK